MTSPMPLRSRDGFELVRTTPQPHGLVALLYRRVPKPDPVDPWAIDPGPDPDWTLGFPDQDAS